MPPPPDDPLDALHAELTAIWARRRAREREQRPTLLRDLHTCAWSMLGTPLDVSAEDARVLEEIAARVLTAARKQRANHQRAGGKGGRGRTALDDAEKALIDAMAKEIRGHTPYTGRGDGSQSGLATRIAKKLRLNSEHVRRYLREINLR